MGIENGEMPEWKWNWRYMARDSNAWDLGLGHVAVETRKTGYKAVDFTAFFTLYTTMASMNELNARLLGLPAHLRRVIQVEVLRTMPHIESERFLETVRASCGLPTDTGMLIRIPRDWIFACRSYGDNWRLLRLGQSKCKPAWKVERKGPSKVFPYYNEHHYKFRHGSTQRETARILASQLTKKRGKFTMAVVQRGRITKHVFGNSTVSDAPSFTLAAIRMLENVYA